jgi:heat shock protein HslJ
MRAFLRATTALCVTSALCAATALSLLALSACAGGGASPGSPGSPGGGQPGSPGRGEPARDGLDGRTFLSTSVTEAGKPRPLVAGTRITLRFGGGQVHAEAGCNLMSGPVRFSGDRLVVGDLAVTEKGCAPELHAQDQWLNKLLRASPTWRLTGSQLALTDGGTEVRMDDRVVADPDRPLAGTRWEVDTIIDKGAAGSVPAGKKAFLVFETDGGVTGSTGCNSLSTRATVAGKKITFAPVITTKMACDEAANALEQAVLRVLEHSPVTYQIEAGHLTLTAPDGTGLRLTAT